MELMDDENDEPRKPDKRTLEVCIFLFGQTKIKNYQIKIVLTCLINYI